MKNENIETDENHEDILSKAETIKTSLLEIQKIQTKLKQELHILHHSLQRTRDIMKIVERTPIEERNSVWKELPKKIMKQNSDFSDKKSALNIAAETENETLMNLIDLNLPMEEKYNVVLETPSDKEIAKLKKIPINTKSFHNDSHSKNPQPFHHRLLNCLLKRKSPQEEVSLNDKVDFSQTQKLNVTDKTFPISHEQLVALSITFVVENFMPAYPIDNVHNIQKDPYSKEPTASVWQNKNEKTFSFGGQSLIYLLHEKEEV